MKQLLSIFVFLISINSFSQSEKFVYDINGLNPKFLVENIDSISQSELYQKALNWVKESFKNTDEVIQTTIENEKIRFEGFTDNAICFGKGLTASCEGLKYFIDLSFKDGRYKFEPITLSYNVKTYGNINVDLNKGLYWNKKGKLRKVYEKIPNQVETLFNDLNESLKAYVSGKLKKDDW